MKEVHLKVKQTRRGQVEMVEKKVMSIDFFSSLGSSSSSHYSIKSGDGRVRR